MGLLSLARRTLLLEVVPLMPLEMPSGGVALPAIGADKWAPADVSWCFMRLASVRSFYCTEGTGMVPLLCGPTGG